MAISDVLHHLAVDPASLAPAPSRQVHREAAARAAGAQCPCAGCVRPARATGIIEVPGCGRRGLDRCRYHLRATIGLQPSKVPGTVAEIIADLRAAEAEVEVQPIVVIDDEGGCRG